MCILCVRIKINKCSFEPFHVWILFSNASSHSVSDLKKKNLLYTGTARVQEGQLTSPPQEARLRDLMSSATVLLSLALSRNSSGTTWMSASFTSFMALLILSTSAETPNCCCCGFPHLNPESVYAIVCTSINAFNTVRGLHVGFKKQQQKTTPPHTVFGGFISIISNYERVATF